MRRLAVAAIVLVGLVAGCGGGKDEGQRIGQGKDSVVVGGAVPDSFPDDIPLPEGTEFIIEDDSIPDWQFDVPLNPPALQKFYADELEGWEVESSGDEIVDESVAGIGFTATFTGGKMDVGAIEPAGTSRMIVTMVEGQETSAPPTTIAPASTTAAPTRQAPTTAAPTTGPTAPPPTTTAPPPADPAHCTSGPNCERGWNLDTCEGFLGAVDTAGRPATSGETQYLFIECGIDYQG